MTPSRLKNEMKRELRKWVPIYGLAHWNFDIGGTFLRSETGIMMGINIKEGVKLASVHGAEDFNYSDDDSVEICIKHELLHLMISDIGLDTVLGSLQNKETSKVISDMVEVLCDRVAVATGRAYEAGLRKRDG